MSNGKHSRKFKAFLLTVGLLLGLGLGAGRSGGLEVSFNNPPQEKNCTKGKRPCPGGVCVDKSEPCDGRQYLIATDYYFSRTKDPKKVEALLGLMQGQMKEFTSSAQKLTSLGCPPGMILCPNTGSCVNSATKCNSHQGFKELSIAFQKEASYYFTNWKQPEAVEALLRDRLKDFTLGARKLTGLGCPPNQRECPGGSCVSPGRGCD